MKQEVGGGVGQFIGQFTVLVCAFSIAAAMIGYGLGNTVKDKDKEVSLPVIKSEKTVVIDPGHGGEDGGAVAADGTVEKNLNLDFGITLNDICGVLGIKSVLTRDTDKLLYDKYNELDDYNGKKKVYDLKNRLRFTEEAGEDTVFVGIHMNKFPDPKYSGTQVYYSPNNEDSMALANILQSKVKSLLQPENDRQTKKAGSSIFLLKRLTTPAILAECGFLSNEAETARLKSGEYKKEFSLTTAVAIGEFISSCNK